MSLESSAADESEVEITFAGSSCPVTRETPVPIDVSQTLHDWNPETAQAMTHIWRKQDGPKSAFRRRPNGFMCSSCRLWVEDTSNNDTPPHYRACRPTFTRTTEFPPAEQPITIHHWVKGHFDKSNTCNHCSKPLSSKMVGFQSAGYRCAWCKNFMHTQCLSQKKDAWLNCDLGEFGPLTLGSANILLHPVVPRAPATANGVNERRQTLASGRVGQRNHTPSISLTVDDVDMYFPGRRGRQHDGHAAASPGSRRSSEPFGGLNLATTRSQSSGSLRTNKFENSAVDEEDPSDADELDVDLVAKISGLLDGCHADSLDRLTPEQKKSFHANLRRASWRKRQAEALAGAKERALHRAASNEHKGPLAFSIVAEAKSYPLLVFVNPKSGGNQGAKLMQQLLWYLNPRQIFNLMAKTPDGKVQGPRPGLEHFKNVPNARILVCGGDGTIGWVLNELDNMGLSHRSIPVGTVPLGTGNDMARALKSGGGYEGESVKKLLNGLLTCLEVKLDRWSLQYEQAKDEDNTLNASCPPDVPLSTELPLSVINNYFSFGSDAWAALGFHLARERDPAKFSSRIHNKAFYGIQGAKDIFQRKFKNLSNMVELRCDGKDYTEIIRRKGLEAVAFLNIYSYAAGTRPWGTKAAVDNFKAPRIDDGLVEVVGFESALALAKGVMRVGHAYRICQCSEAELTLLQALPVQVDGEPCMLAAGTVKLSFKNQATMLVRPKGRFKRDMENNRIRSAFPSLVPRAHDGDEDDDELTFRSPRNSQVAPLNRDEAIVPEQPVALRVTASSRASASAVASQQRSSRPSIGSPLAVSEEELSSTRHSWGPASLEGEAPSLARGSMTTPASPLSSKPERAAAARGSFLSPSTESLGASAQASDEEGQAPLSNPKLLLDDDVSDDSDDTMLQPVPIYLVPILEGDRTGELQPLGNAGLPVHLPLANCREYLTSTLGTSFRRSRGWRFLKFTQAANGEGTYASVKRKVEGSLTPHHFMNETTAGRRGLFVCCITPAVEPIPSLIAAAREGDKTKLEQLLDSGVNPNNRDLTGTTALHAAAIGNYSAVIRLLLTKGKADPNTQDLAKRTPLHYAAERGLLSACEDLVRGNASIEVVDRCGLTPPQAAQKAGFADVAAAMRSVSGRASAVNSDDEDSESFV